MKFILSILIVVFAFPESLSAQSIMSYNIRYDNAADGENAWNNRKDRLTAQIKHHSPGILGMQEALHRQVIYLDSALINYAFAGVGRDDGKMAGEYSPVFIDTTQYELLESDTFWLSDTPEQPSVGWDAALERICTWVQIRSKRTGQRFLVLNTHFDHRGTLARLRSAQLITQKVFELNRSGDPVILTGDLNSLPDSEIIGHLNSYLNDSRDVSTKDPEGPKGTFNGFDVNHPLNDRIDYIFVSDYIKVTEYLTILEIKDQRTPSDHLPVLIRIDAGE